MDRLIVVSEGNCCLKQKYRTLLQHVKLACDDEGIADNRYRLSLVFTSGPRL